MKKFKLNFPASTVLKMCAKNNITVIDVKKIDGECSEISVGSEDVKKVKKCFNLKKFKVNFFLITILIFSIIFCITLSMVNNYVLKIEIDGSSPEIEQTALEIAKNYVKDVRKKSSIDVDVLKSQMLNNNKIALCDVKIIGLVLYVSVKENESIVETDFSPIVSSVDGVVESVNLASGTALVEKGMYVKKGDLLIVPEIVVDGEIVPCKAIGQVVVLAYSQKEEIFLENQIEYVETGKILTQKYFTILNNFVKISKGQVDFSTYEKIVSTKKSKIGFIPITIITEKYFETKPKSIVKDFENLKETEMARVLEELKTSVGSKAIYSENVVYKKLSSGVYKITATVQYPITIV